MVSKANSQAFKGKTFYMPLADAGVARMLVKFGGVWTRNIETDFDAVVWTGGEDICPFLYGEAPLLKTHSNIKRDIKDVHVFKNVPQSMPKIGICRGAQLLNVLCGGRMWQDVNNHTRSHDIQFMNDHTIKVTSTHHQMMIPTEDAMVLGWAREATHKQRDGEGVNIHDNVYEDAEIVFYDKFNTLCFQPHPEYQNHDDCTNMFIELVCALFEPDKKEENAKPF